MDEAEVSADGRYLFITPTLHNLINAVDSYKSKAMLDKFAGVVDVPQSRFFTAVDLYDGKSSGETVGGFVKDPSQGKNINFMIIQKGAVIQFTKHTVNKVISPADNQESDGWKFFYRAYGLTDAYENKAAGIYLHKSES